MAGGASPQSGAPANSGNETRTSRPSWHISFWERRRAGCQPVRETTPGAEEDRLRFSIARHLRLPAPKSQLCFGIADGWQGNHCHPRGLRRWGLIEVSRSSSQASCTSCAGRFELRTSMILAVSSAESMSGRSSVAIAGPGGRELRRRREATGPQEVLRLPAGASSRWPHEWIALFMDYSPGVAPCLAPSVGAYIPSPDSGNNLSNSADPTGVLR